MSADIIYSIATGRVRRIVTPSSNLQMHVGEAQLTVSTAQYSSFTGLDSIQTFVKTSTGKTPTGDRYVSTDTSYNVISVHIADPTCGDVAPQHGASLVPHATANVRDLLWGGNNVLPNTSSVITNKKQILSRNQPLP